LRQPAAVAAIKGDFDQAEKLVKEIEPRITGSRSGMIQQRGFMSNLALARGRVREGLRLRAEQRERQAEAGAPALALLNAGLDSVMAAAALQEDLSGARAILDRVLRRTPIDSVPYLDRDYGNLLFVAMLAQDTARARQFHSESRKSWESYGKLLDRPTWEALDDASLAVSLGQYQEALESVDRASRLPIDRKDHALVRRFLVLDRLKQVDSAIVAGERYLVLTEPFRLQQDAFFRGGIVQRLGEMYESKGEFDKALTHYNAFVELWKNADPELQPRVRDVRSRVERLQRRRG
jgi:tetratricopeptide (TPR) repeat protein